MAVSKLRSRSREPNGDLEGDDREDEVLAASGAALRRLAGSLDAASLPDPTALGAAAGLDGESSVWHCVARNLIESSC